ncbi:P22_AR N-terminal domain [Sebaldella termitidis]|uniref:Antirepressor protein ant N-terminal domain-containing protein n=1 Tax=Sebaldella termitidis (strain ATCC 33386 / NCTC 11300) TaxID=526218 RepID=D1APE9_SEBTE|nr:hypothetical protein Sterm_3141 [Sebaldella termitidis ATCC 33386]SUI25315.1 P22_AR N-terminal domain [Sebaldella termitidis]
MRHICNGLKLTESQRKYIVNKFNKDETLKGGKKIYPLITNGVIQSTSLIELDYLPLWLAKINPARFSKELKDKLLEYQLRAKDVLAAAFLDNKPNQLTLPKPKEHKIIKKYYNGVPVMSIKDLSVITKSTIFNVHYYAGKKKTIINNYEMINFKKENPNLSERLSHMTILYREEVINICKKMKIYDKVKPQILAYFDDFIPEAENKLSDDIPDQNKKAELLLQVLPYIDEKSLRDHLVAKIIKLVDDRILGEYKSDNLHMRFIESKGDIIHKSENESFRSIVVDGDAKDIETPPNTYVTNCMGYKVMIQKK